jgi:radical SAM protein with 4Fe4S-binding SPASM domain
LLDEGFPPENTVVCICLTKYSLETIEETLDWFLDKVEYPYWVDLIPFKLEGYGKEHFSYLEPGLSDIERSMKYRAKKVGEHWLRVGVMDMTQYFCRTYFYITYDGLVLPCAFFRDKPVGNVYEQSLDEIVEKNKDNLFFNFKLKGKCGNCENNDVCFGCRANAYTYLGDRQASDPKCWMNPEAKEYYFT